jgi:hypothetical protein
MSDPPAWRGWSTQKSAPAVRPRPLGRPKKRGPQGALKVSAPWLLPATARPWWVLDKLLPEPDKCFEFVILGDGPAGDIGQGFEQPSAINDDGTIKLGVFKLPFDWLHKTLRQQELAVCGVILCHRRCLQPSRTAPAGTSPSKSRPTLGCGTALSVRSPAPLSIVPNKCVLNWPARGGHRAVWGVIAWCMPGKRSSKGSPAARPANAPTNFVTWKARAAAELKRQHSVNPGIITARMWKHLYIQGKTPQKAADQAAVSAYSVQSAADRLKRR